MSVLLNFAGWEQGSACTTTLIPYLEVGCRALARFQVNCDKAAEHKADRTRVLAVWSYMKHMFSTAAHQTRILLTPTCVNLIPSADGPGINTSTTAQRKGKQVFYVVEVAYNLARIGIRTRNILTASPGAHFLQTFMLYALSHLNTRLLSSDRFLVSQPKNSKNHVLSFCARLIAAA